MDPVLSRIPGLAGYLSGQANDQQMQMGQLQQMGALQGILANAQKQQMQQQEMAEMGQLKAVVQQAGGDPAKAVQALIASGNPRAIALAEKLKGFMPKPAEPYTLAPGGQRRGSNNEIIAEAPFKPAKEQNPSNLARLMAERDALPEGDPRRANYDNAIRKESEVARQIVPPVIRVDSGRPKAPSGFQWNATGDALEPIKGGPKDPTINLTGGRESVYVQRMMMGANQAAKDLSNVVQLPLTASTGLFGGRRQGAGLLDAGKEVLANKATGQEAQAYNAMATGFQRSLAQIESAGLMPSGSLTHQMDAVLFKEGDTNLTKMHKLAQTRQIVEAGMEVIQANPRVSPSEKEKIKSVLDSIRKSVPFTHSDLISLQALQETNPAATLKDVIGKKPKWEIVR